MDKFEKKFEELTRQHDHSVVFNDFLKYTVDQFRIDYNQKHFNHETYNKEEYEIFFELFQYLILHTHEMIEKGNEWYDMLGIFYEDVIQSKWKAGNRGQFFTPGSVCDVLADCTVNFNGDDSKLYRALDSACGSSRTLLAYHVRRPYDICVGQDLDHTSCLMSVINFVLHGVKGTILNMNSLDRDFFGAWKVNEYVDMGLPMTVEYTQNLNSALTFIGDSNDKVEDVELMTNDHGDVLEVVSRDVQTTLI